MSDSKQLAAAPIRAAIAELDPSQTLSVDEVAALLAAPPKPELGDFAFPCPHCRQGCADYEALQMHVFTACAKADADGAGSGGGGGAGGGGGGGAKKVAARPGGPAPARVPSPAAGSARAAVAAAAAARK